MTDGSARRVIGLFMPLRHERRYTVRQVLPASMEEKRQQPDEYTGRSPSITTVTMEEEY